MLVFLHRLVPKVLKQVLKADFITVLQFLDDVLTTPVGSTYFNELQGKTKQLLDFVGLYFRANDMYGRPPLPATIDGVENVVEEWFRYGCYCQLRDPTYGVRPGQIFFLNLQSSAKI